MRTPVADLRERLDAVGVDPDANRALALAGAAVLTASYLGVLHHVTDVAGNPDHLLAVVAGTLLGATALARYVRARVALSVGGLLVAAGATWYLLSLPKGVLLLAQTGRIVADTAALLTGLSVLRMTNVGVWALAFAPGPVFLSWYFAVRRRYVGSVLVGGVALGFLIMTGDAGTSIALLGVIGAAAAMGFGGLDVRGGTVGQAEAVAVVLAAMIAVTLTVSVVPGGASQPLSPSGGGGGPTVEGSLVDADDRVDILGTIRLTPEVRYTVRSEERGYWRVAAYDRYTGRGWVRTGDTSEFAGPLARAYTGSQAGPPGEWREIRQTYEAEARVETMPAIWQPVEVFGGMQERTLVTDLGGLQPTATFLPGDSYTVLSRSPVATPDALRRAGRDYPDPVAARYLELPRSVPDRVGERTARITANADNPYDTATVIERWLRNNRRYSLDVDRPDGNIADAFLFEMEAGYCTYYATTMVTMLRTQGIPARFVVGYTPGERVADRRWVVRGFDSHAWVEVYFPDHGWIRFDPTPAGPRRATERDRLETARAANRSNVDTAETRGTTPTPTPSPGQVNESGVNATATLSGLGDIMGEDVNGSTSSPTPTLEAAAGAGGDGGGPRLPELPSRERLALGLVLLAGAAAGAHRTGLADRAYRSVWLRFQPRTDPGDDVERAFRRLEYLLGRDARPREPDETPRQYLDALGAGDRARTVLAIYERTRYGGAGSRADADRAVRLVNELVADRLRLGGIGRQ